MPASILYARSVLIIGATSGIGRDLALAIHALPTNPTVIVAGRRRERLAEIVSRPKTGQGKFDSAEIDVSAGSVTLQKFVEQIVKAHPEASFLFLDTIIFSQGVQRGMNFKQAENINLDVLRKELDINYTSVVTLTALFMPHFLKLNVAGKNTFVISVSSNLGISPVPTVPGYCASKAALHSFVMSLAAQMHGTKVNVMEIIPSVVATELHGGGRGSGMPLDEFTERTMKGLKNGDQFVITSPNVVKRFAKWEEGKMDAILQFVK